MEITTTRCTQQKWTIELLDSITVEAALRTANFFLNFSLAAR